MALQKSCQKWYVCDVSVFCSATLANICLANIGQCREHDHLLRYLKNLFCKHCADGRMLLPFRLLWIFIWQILRNFRSILAYSVTSQTCCWQILHNCSSGCFSNIGRWFFGLKRPCFFNCRLIVSRRWNLCTSKVTNSTNFIFRWILCTFLIGAQCCV